MYLRIYIIGAMTAFLVWVIMNINVPHYPELGFMLFEYIIWMINLGLVIASFRYNIKLIYIAFGLWTLRIYLWIFHNHAIMYANYDKEIISTLVLDSFTAVYTSTYNQFFFGFLMQKHDKKFTIFNSCVTLVGMYHRLFGLENLIQS